MKHIKRKKLLIIFLLLIVLITILSSYKVVKIVDLDFDLAVMSEEDKKIWKQDTILNIFNNDGLGFNKNKLIKPGSHGTYHFVIRNKTPYDALYEITCHKESDTDIVLKYRLRNYEDYKAGNNEEWKDITELKITDSINKKDNDDYYLEWKWDDSKNDSKYGIKGGYYTLHINIASEILDN